jgi:hypothetical protein
LRFFSLQNRYKTSHRDGSKAPQKPRFSSTTNFQHPVLEPEIVDRRQFLGRQHDLQSLVMQIVHGITQNELIE